MARKSRKDQIRAENSGQAAVAVPSKPLPSPAPTYLAVGYARLSIFETRDRADSEALQNQKELLRQYIVNAPELQLVGIFEDNGQTGTNFDRAGFETMMETVRSGRANCIVVKDLSRFGRDYPIYGYVKSPADRRLLIPDPEAADIVRRIFERCNAGEGPTRIASGLNRDGVPTPSQRKRDLGSKRQLWNSDRLQNEWSDTAVTRILRDERYTGKLIGIKTTRTELGNQNSSRKQSKEDWIVVPGAFEAIISQETFDEAQRQLERLRRRSGKRETNAPAVHLFSRKLKCGHCGLALGRHVVELGVYYRCEGRAWNSGAACLGARLFEDDLIRTVLASIRFQARLAGKVEERLDKVENAERRERETLWEQRRRVQMKLEHLTTQKAEAFLLFNQGDLTPKAYDATCAKLDKAILEQRAKLLDMSGTQTSTQDSAALHCREDIARLKELSNLRTLDRQTVEKLIQSIRVYDGKRIEIVWNFSDSYMKLLTREEQNHEE